MKPQLTEYAQKTAKPVAKSTPKPYKECQGDCVHVLYTIFCDDVDTAAECSDDTTCCIMNSVSDFYFTHNKHVKITGNGTVRLVQLLLLLATCLFTITTTYPYFII